MGQDKFGRDMHKVTCSECGQETEVPFKPDGNRPVYCRDCYMKHKKPFNGRRGGFRSGSSEGSSEDSGSEEF